MLDWFRPPGPGASCQLPEIFQHLRCLGLFENWAWICICTTGNQTEWRAEYFLLNITINGGEVSGKDLDGIAKRCRLFGQTLSMGKNKKKSTWKPSYIMDFYSHRLMYVDCRVQCSVVYSEYLVRIRIPVFRVFRIRILLLKTGQLIFGKF